MTVARIAKAELPRAVICDSVASSHSCSSVLEDSMNQKRFRKLPHGSADLICGCSLVWLVITIFGDLLPCDDISGWGKAL
jgi:hypothetical protein